jgi:hypothetical protein
MGRGVSSKCWTLTCAYMTRSCSIGDVYASSSPVSLGKCKRILNSASNSSLPHRPLDRRGPIHTIGHRHTTTRQWPNYPSRPSLSLRTSILRNYQSAVSGKYDYLGPADVPRTRWQNVISSYEEAYGSTPSHIIRAPGRVNILGEHIDYSLFVRM